MYRRTLSTLIIGCLLLCATPSMVQAQKNDASTRKQWMTEIRNYKHECLIRDLKLSSNQQTAFFAKYDAMDAELAQVNKEIRDLEDRLTADKSATEAELTSGARALWEQRQRESEIEMRYWDDFRRILTPRQLFQLKGAERKFTTQLVRHHSRLRKSNKK